VLLVDDDLDIRETVSELIELLGHECVTAGSGQDALEILESYSPDLILVDIGLPDMAGHELAAIVRRTYRRSVAIVAVSGRSQPSDIARSLRAGIDGHLAKPIGCEQLRQVIG
jgi:two-component system CheB/CheR fusion protein